MQKPYKEMLKIGTWNARSMTQPEKIKIIKREMERYQLNILALTKTRGRESGDLTSDGYRLFYSEDLQSRRGVGLMSEKQAAKTVKEVQTVNDRLLIVRLKSEPVDLNIIVVYIPTSAYVDEDVEEINEQMEERMEALPSKEYAALLGDMNAIVGEGREGTVVVSHGRMLVDFWRKNRLCIMTT